MPIYTKDCRHIAYSHKIHLQMIIFIFQIWKPPWLGWLYDNVTAVKSYGVHHCDIYDVFPWILPFSTIGKMKFHLRILSTPPRKLYKCHLQYLNHQLHARIQGDFWGPSTCHRHWRDQFSKLSTPHLSVIIHLATLGFPRVPEEHPEKRDVGNLLNTMTKIPLKLGKRE